MLRIMYRPHRRGFDESMAEAKKFNAMGALKDYLGFGSVEYYDRDDRITPGVDTFIVLDTHGDPLGFCWFIEER